MREAIINLVVNAIIAFYLLPAIGCIGFFTIAKIEDSGKPEDDKIFTPDFYSYGKTVLICLIPVLNVAIFAILAYDCFSFVIRGMQELRKKSPRA